MSIKTKKKDIHKQRMEVIRPYVSFNFDLRKELSPYQKSKIKRYYEEVHQALNNSVKIYKPRSKKRLNIAKQYSGQDKSLTQLKTAFIPTPDPNAKLYFTKESLVVKTKYVDSRHISFNMKSLTNDTEKEVNRAMRNAKGDSFTVQAGQYQMPDAVKKPFIASYVTKLANQYSQKGKNNYFGNWLFGVYAHKFDKQADYNEYEKAKKTAKENKKRRRKIK